MSQEILKNNTDSSQNETEKQIEEPAEIENNENLEDIKDFGKEQIDSVLNESESAKQHLCNGNSLLELGGSLEELGGETREVDFEIDRVAEEAAGLITEWIELENPEWDQNKFYRVVGEDAYDDFKNVGKIRSKTKAKPNDRLVKKKIVIGRHPTFFPSFSKGEPLIKEYGSKEKDSYIFESDAKMYKQGDKNPKTGNVIQDKHWAYRPFNQEGEARVEMDASEITNIYKKDNKEKIYKKNNEKNESGRSNI